MIASIYSQGKKVASVIHTKDGFKIKWTEDASDLERDYFKKLKSRSYTLHNSTRLPPSPIHCRFAREEIESFLVLEQVVPFEVRFEAKPPRDNAKEKKGLII